jgi:hypothetical protein
MIAALHTKETGTMTRQFRNAAFSHAHSVVAANFHAASERGLETFKDFSDGAIACARDRHEAMTRFADNLWTSKKLLDDELAHYVSENIQAVFGAFERITQAKSGLELVQLQSEFMRTFTAQVAKQAREFVRLSVSASEQALQATSARSNSGRTNSASAQASIPVIC